MENILVWKPIATAPAEVDLELSVYAEGVYHQLVFPSDAMADAGAT